MAIEAGENERDERQEAERKLALAERAQLRKDREAQRIQLRKEVDAKRKTNQS
jgi:hypothetical protein